MSKLPIDKRFLDLSDYARPFAIKLAKLFQSTWVGAYTFTFLFLLVGILSSYLIYKNTWLTFAAILLPIKSLLDAADGEIARLTNTPSSVGRYFDSISDFIINLLLFLSIGIHFGINIFIVFISLILFQLQGSIYSYYYIIKRHQCNGDTTSRIFEKEKPIQYEKDNPVLLNIFHKIFLVIYGWQDFLIYKLDSNAITSKELPSWFLTLTSL
ncbi:MAG: CDP-alcohol phosphatidyltransferase family protein, partial [Ignavibacteriae bacterium]|nr:CDP-alcohol phosphatidyltransferase family protein [Ignavibacteriota bacterium]